MESVTNLKVAIKPLTMVAESMRGAMHMLTG
jgi:hypothetical protein